jgi:hypothetical protein
VPPPQSLPALALPFIGIGCGAAIGIGGLCVIIGLALRQDSNPATTAKFVIGGLLLVAAGIGLLLLSGAPLTAGGTR